MIEMLRGLAHRDPLTGLHNRRYLFETGNLLHAAALRNNISLAVFMVDIDDFKKINDTYGHEAGDEVIVRCAHVLKEVFRRDDDIVGRIGGEEFCAIRTFDDLASLHEHVEGLRQRIVNQSLSYAGDSISFTVSIGGCTHKLKTLAEMIKSADRELYEAKKTGKNKICLT
jgi:diguanylate cyclase (GGDEF)-like protein